MATRPEECKRKIISTTEFLQKHKGLFIYNIFTACNNVHCVIVSIDRFSSYDVYLYLYLNHREIFLMSDLSKHLGNEKAKKLKSQGMKNC